MNQNKSEHEEEQVTKLVTLVMLVFLSIQILFYGVNDIITLILLLISTGIMYITIYKFQNTTREILKLTSKENSQLYYILTRRSIITTSISLLVSLISSVILLTILKGIVINYNWFMALFIIVFFSIFVTTFIKVISFKINSIDENFHDDIVNKISKYIGLIYLVFIFNLLLTIFLTIFDYTDFLNNSLSLLNFEESSFENKVINNDNNYISKNLINIYLLFDSFKIAFINFIYESFGINKSEGFYISIAIIGLLNFMKLLGFSFAFVYLQTTLIELIDKFKIIKKDK